MGCSIRYRKHRDFLFLCTVTNTKRYKPRHQGWLPLLRQYRLTVPLPYRGDRTTVKNTKFDRGCEQSCMIAGLTWVFMNWCERKKQRVAWSRFWELRDRYHAASWFVQHIRNGDDSFAFFISFFCGAFSWMAEGLWNTVPEGSLRVLVEQ